MPRRNVVVESARQRRQRLLRNERAEVLGKLFDELEDNNARRNEMTAQMDALQHVIEELKIDARRIAERIDEESSYYRRGELQLAQWPQDCQLDPIPRFVSKEEAHGRSPRPIGIPRPRWFPASSIVIPEELLPI